MKVVYLITRSEPIGGAQVHVRDVASALLEQGHHPIVVTGGWGLLNDILRTRGVETLTVNSLRVPINPLRDLRALKQIRKLLQTLRPDLVSVHSSKAGILGRVAGHTLGIPVVLTAHGWAFTPGVPRREASIYRWIERLAEPFAVKIITVSEFDRQLALKRGISSSDKVITVHNGMPDIADEMRGDPGLTPVRLAMVARFEPQKDHSTLLHALAGLTDQSWNLDLIGDGSLMADIMELTRRLKLDDRVRFWGQRMDVDARLSEAQLFLLITKWEGFPRSILEAMRAGLPVIATAVGGIAESVIDGETGFTVAPGDVNALRERVKLLIEDAQLRVKLGHNARRLYERNFTLAATVEKTLAVYREVIGESSMPVLADKVSLKGST